MPVHDKWLFSVCVSVYVQMYTVPLQVVIRVTTGWTHNLQTPEITSYENGKMGEGIGKTAMWLRHAWMCVCVCLSVCVFCTYPSCQGCLWRSTWGWRQCLDRREVWACHSLPDPQCPREPTPPDTCIVGGEGSEKDKRNVEKEKRKKKKKEREKLIHHVHTDQQNLHVEASK